MVHEMELTQVLYSERNKKALGTRPKEAGNVTDKTIYIVQFIPRLC